MDRPSVDPAMLTATDRGGPIGTPLLSEGLRSHAWPLWFLFIPYLWVPISIYHMALQALRKQYWTENVNSVTVTYRVSLCRAPGTVLQLREALNEEGCPSEPAVRRGPRRQTSGLPELAALVLLSDGLRPRRK